MLGRFSATLEISRPHNMIAAGGSVVAGYVLSGGRSPGEIILPFVFTAMITGLGNLINDYHDRDIDRVNKPARPIPSGRLNPRDVLVTYIVGSIATTAVMAFVLPTAMVLLVLAWEVLLWLYARTGKRVAVVGNITIAGIAASAFLAGAIPTGNFAATSFPALLAFLLVFGRELFKGAEDIEGDRGAGATTIAVRFGPAKAAYLGAMSLFLCVLVTPVPALIEYYGPAYALVMELLFVPGVLYAAYLAVRTPERDVLHRASRILKIEMFCGIVAMALGRL